MILSHEHEFIFLCNGKTGTSSIETALREYQDGAEFEVGVSGLYHKKHVPPSVLRGMLGGQVWEDYFTFCFVRNPWDWFVSQYFWNWAPDPISKKAALHSPIRTLRRYQERRKQQRYLRELDQFSTQEIRQTYDLLKRYRGVYQADSLFQYHYAYAPSGEKLVDFVGRFEQIEADFAKAMEHIGLDVRLPHRNPTDHKSYQEYYTAETAALVGDLYEIDARTFDYEHPFSDSE